MLKNLDVGSKGRLNGFTNQSYYTFKVRKSKKEKKNQMTIKMIKMIFFYYKN